MKPPSANTPFIVYASVLHSEQPRIAAALLFTMTGGFHVVASGLRCHPPSIVSESWLRGGLADIRDCPLPVLE